jgi:hypothetical protein
VGFFSTTCQPCRDALPQFIAEITAGIVDHALAVVIGDPVAGADLIDQIRAAGISLSTEPQGGPVSTTFGITSFPTIVSSVDGRVVEVGRRLTLGTAKASALGTAR